MIEFLKKIDQKFDVIFFLPHDEDENGVYLESATYNKPGKLIDDGPIGPAWHIYLFRKTDEGVTHKDSFVGIFSDPREYISNLIPQDWYGFVAKKTTTSKKFISETIDKLNEIYYNTNTTT
jgi:hypothetical protein